MTTVGPSGDRRSRGRRQPTARPTRRPHRHRDRQRHRDDDRRRRPMRSPKLAALELKRFGRGKLPRAALVALLLLPLLYGALYLWSFWDPYGRLDQIPVALVNDDKGATVDGKKIDGRRRHHQGAARQRDLRVARGERRRGPRGRRGRHVLPVADHAGGLQRADRVQLGRRPRRPAPSRSGRTTPTTTSSGRSRGRSSPRCARPRRPRRPRSFLDRIFISFSDIHDEDRGGRRRAPTSSRTASTRRRRAPRTSRTA